MSAASVSHCRRSECTPCVLSATGITLPGTTRRHLASVGRADNVKLAGIHAFSYRPIVVVDAHANARYLRRQVRHSPGVVPECRRQVGGHVEPGPPTIHGQLNFLPKERIAVDGPGDRRRRVYKQPLSVYWRAHLNNGTREGVDDDGDRC